MPTLTPEQELTLVKREIKRLAKAHPGHARKVFFLLSVHSPDLARRLRAWLTEEDSSQ